MLRTCSQVSCARASWRSGSEDGREVGSGSASVIEGAQQYPQTAMLVNRVHVSAHTGTYLEDRQVEGSIRVLLSVAEESADYPIQRGARAHPEHSKVQWVLLLPS